MPCHDCVNRRAFLAKSALAAAAFAGLDACGDGQIGAPERAPTPVGGPYTIRLADFPALQQVGTLVDLGSAAPERAAIRTGPTTFVAFSKLCTHQQCTTDVRNNRFDCPCHGSRFANDGSVITGPADQPLAKLTATFNATDNTLTVS
jgi:cytochrome b6-f complex iron-sulfur subunit